jgi:two-component system phosphate regulon sensor histidine kinase PhoR
MWSSRLLWKSLFVYGGLYAAFAVTYMLTVAPQQRELLIQQLRSRLHEEAQLLRDQLTRAIAERQTEKLQSFIVDFGRRTKVRLTVVERTGKVLADSDEEPQRMRDHAERPEIVAATQRGFGEDIRQSATTGQRMFYYALPIQVEGESHGFVRVALPFDDIDREIARLNRRVLLLSLGFGALVLPLSVILLRGIAQLHARLTSSARAIAAGDEVREIPATSKGELGQLVTSFNSMLEHWKHQIVDLRQKSDQMLTVLSGMTEGVIAVDPSQRVLLANPASFSLLDITTKDVVGRPLLEAIRSRDVQQIVLDCLQDDEMRTREKTMTTGNRRLLKLLAARLPGTPCPGVVVVLHDITDLRRLENLRRDFVANVSHELKTPLATIKAYAETLRLGALDDPTNRLKFVERIEEQANRLHQLILDLLHLARVETGKEAFQFEEVAIVDAVETCVDQLGENAVNAGVTLITEPSVEALSVWADIDGLQTILDNLVSNAIKYTPRDGQVTLRWRRDGRFATIEVQDNGIGIAAQDQERIFERFYRVDRARSRELGGTGLGLAIVKHLVQSFGGEVGVTSELRRGSTFTVRIPVAPSVAT